jgi:hypothetical protein
MKKIFDEHHIEMPFPHLTLYWGQPKEGMSSPLRVAMDNNHPVPREDDYSREEVSLRVTVWLLDTHPLALYSDW